PRAVMHFNRSPMSQSPAAVPSLSPIPYIVMLATALCFSTNIIFGRYVAPETHPFVLAFTRWLAVAAILAPFALSQSRGQIIKVVRENWPLLIALGVLGMGVSGGGVYWGLQMTTATNATLIYSVAPIVILILERIFRNRTIAGRELIGAAVAITGVAMIVLKGDLATLRAMQFNPGDLLIAAATLSWAGYSVLFKSPSLSATHAITLFCVIAAFGALANLPFAIVPLLSGSGLPGTPQAWQALGGIIVVSSLMAFTGYQFGVRRLGPSVAGLFMFLMTPFGVILAVTFLGETLATYQMIAIGAVMIGVITATFPKNLLKL
ncbi:MAG: DMT family transporter, partial [Pseudomonadota bacterium]